MGRLLIIASACDNSLCLKPKSIKEECAKACACGSTYMYISGSSPLVILAVKVFLSDSV